MLPKRNRLKRADFSVRRKWISYTNAFMIIRITSSTAETKISVVVPKVVVKSSVRRHRVKRILYASIEGHNFITNGVDMVLRLTAYPSTVSEKELKMKTDELLTSIKNMLR